MRLPDWEARLADCIAANRQRPFEWGQWDCALWCAAAVEAQTGIDLGADYRGQYSTARGSAEALREIGQGTLLKTIDAMLPRKPVGFAQRGDVVMVGTALGICCGAYALFVGEERLDELSGAPLGKGLVKLPRHLWRKAWGV